MMIPLLLISSMGRQRLPVTGPPLMNANAPITVYVVDDDAGVRKALARMFRSVGFTSHQFPSTKDLLDTKIDTHDACIIADLNIVGDEPIALPAHLKERHLDLPVVFISADDSDTNRARVRSVGGFGLFRKPVDSQALVDAVRWAIDGPRSPH